MNSVILCEGETDQILLSYYFNECFGFEYCSRLPKIAPKKLKENNKSESVCCYNRNDDNLIIWAVGGHSNFQKAMRKILQQNKINSLTNGYYSHICIMTDNDSEEETTKFWQEINQILNDYEISEQIRAMEWVKSTQLIDFDEKLSINLLGICVPVDESGALETALLNALAEDNGKTYIVKKSQDIIHDLLENKEKFSNEYLSSRRDKIKAPLAVFLGITIPERTFINTDELLKSINWEKQETIRNMFKPFDIYKIDSTSS